jgi:hypothetical protein
VPIQFKLFQCCITGIEPCLIEHGEKDFGGDHHFFASSEFFQQPASDYFGRAVGIPIRGIEKIDTQFHRVCTNERAAASPSTHGLHRGDPTSSCRPTKINAGDLEPGTAGIDVMPQHPYPLSKPEFPSWNN